MARTPSKVKVQSPFLTGTSGLFPLTWSRKGTETRSRQMLGTYNTSPGQGIKVLQGWEVLLLGFGLTTVTQASQPVCPPQANCYSPPRASQKLPQPTRRSVLSPFPAPQQRNTQCLKYSSCVRPKTLVSLGH